MIHPPTPFHTLTTDQLVELAIGLDAIVDGSLAPGTPDYAELIDTETLAAAQAEVGHSELSPLLDELAFALQKRHTEIAASLAAWHAWNHRTVSWGQALCDGAEAAAAEAGAA